MCKDFIPPKPQSKPDNAGLFWMMRAFREDLFSIQPERFYRSWMAEFILPFYKSYVVNDPEIIKVILKERPDDFPKSAIIGAALRSLLGESVFVTNGALWLRQRRIIDPSFERGRLRETVPVMREAGHAAVMQLARRDLTEPIEVEEVASRFAADIIFRTLFSMPISEMEAKQTYQAFRAYQRCQPLSNLGSLVNSPRLTRLLEGRKSRREAARLREHLTRLTRLRQKEIGEGRAPDDLATKLMTTIDPQSGKVFSTQEMIDQVAIFFLAGHETSASALSWALYLLANDLTSQQRVQAEIDAIGGFGALDFANLSKLPFTRDVFQETLRLYPPVPMMVRQTTREELFRERKIPKGSQIIISSFHLHRHERLWDNPDAFMPARFSKKSPSKASEFAYLPFSSGPRICTGAAFAMLEGVIMLAAICEKYSLKPVPDRVPQPVSHLTLRAKDGIYLSFSPRK